MLADYRLATDFLGIALAATSATTHTLNQWRYQHAFFSSLRELGLERHELNMGCSTF